MNVLVVGSGAVGTLLAWVLAASGSSVSIVRRSLGAGVTRDERLVVVRPDGSEGAAGVRAVGAPASVEPALDLVVLAVKAFDVPGALASLPDWPSAAVLTVQNGIGAEEAARERRGGRLIAASLTASVEWRADGRLAWRRRGGIGLASVGDVPPSLLDAVAVAFEGGGLPARRYPDWAAMKWSKLAGNLVANATSALLDRDPAAIYRDPRLFALERAQLREAFAVMRARGLRPVALPGANVRLLALAVALPAAFGRPILARVVGGARGGKDPSLRRHLERGSGPTEATWLNGAVAREGARLGVATPVNATLARLVESAAADRALRDALRRSPDRLLADVAEAAEVAEVTAVTAVTASTPSGGAAPTVAGAHEGADAGDAARDAAGRAG